MLAAVRTETAAILGHTSPRAIDPKSAFKQLGYDSLGAVELRNRLNVLTGLRLPATVVFDHPNPVALAEYVSAQMRSGGQAPPPDSEQLELERAFASIPIKRLRELGLVDLLLRLADPAGDTELSPIGDRSELIDAMDVEQLVKQAMEHSPLATAGEGSQ